MVLIVWCLHVRGIWGDRGCLSSLWLKTNHAGCKEQTHPSFAEDFPPEASYCSPRSQHGGCSRPLSTQARPGGRQGLWGWEDGPCPWAGSEHPAPGQTWGRKGTLPGWLLPDSPVHPSPAHCGPRGAVVPRVLCLQGPGGTQALLGVGRTQQAVRGGRTGAGQRFLVLYERVGG